MYVIDQLTTWRQLRKDLSYSCQLGLVTTMGNLHQGHASLLRQSKAENDKTVLSIYINPSQFDNESDLARYPITLDNDLALAQTCGVDYVLLPNYADIYSDNYTYQVNTTHPFSNIMEGVHRPAHFTGMLTVVLKFLMLVKPQKAYFGEKDFQQLLLVRELVNAFFLDTEIIACPTIREASGLALSSRNNRLSATQRQHAANVYQILIKDQSVEHSKQQLAQLGFIVDYVEQHHNRRFAAVRLDQIRLIDNVITLQEGV